MFVLQMLVVILKILKGLRLQLPLESQYRHVVILRLYGSSYGGPKYQKYIVYICTSDPARHNIIYKI